ncbi:hypothetical protein D3C84_342550 [compost metagenome]
MRCSTARTGCPGAIVVRAGKIISHILETGPQRRVMDAIKLAVIEVREETSALGAGKWRHIAQHGTAAIDGGESHPDGIALGCEGAPYPCPSCQDPGSVIGIPVGKVLDLFGISADRSTLAIAAVGPVVIGAARLDLNPGIAASLPHVATSLVGKVDGWPECLFRISVVIGRKTGVVVCPQLVVLGQIAATCRRIGRVMWRTTYIGIHHQGSIRIGPGAITQGWVVIEFVVLARPAIGIEVIGSGERNRAVAPVITAIHLIGSWIDEKHVEVGWHQLFRHHLGEHRTRVVQGEHDVGLGTGAEIEGRLGDIECPLSRQHWQQSQQHPC